MGLCNQSQFCQLQLQQSKGCVSHVRYECVPNVSAHQLPGLSQVEGWIFSSTVSSLVVAVRSEDSRFENDRVFWRSKVLLCWRGAEKTPESNTTLFIWSLTGWLQTLPGSCVGRCVLSQSHLRSTPLFNNSWGFECWLVFQLSAKQVQRDDVAGRQKELRLTVNPKGSLWCNFRHWCEERGAVYAHGGSGGMWGALLDVVPPAVGGHTALLQADSMTCAVCVGDIVSLVRKDENLTH